MSVFYNNGSELCWVDGAPVMGLPNGPTRVAIGTETYWVDGAPVVTIFGSVGTWSFFPFF